jgi:holo-[acyl-carrier protein] synthase
MKVATGIDMIEIDRVESVVARHGRRYTERVYTANEIAQSGKRSESLAALFAAKEAVSKALGCGIGDVSFHEIEIIDDDKGAPHLQLHGAAAKLAKELCLTTWSVSLSHSLNLAIAMVVGIGE